MAKARDEFYDVGLVVIRKDTSSSDAFWNGQVKTLIYNPDTLSWEAATGGGATGSVVEVSNFPANPATSTLQTTGNNSLASILSELQSEYALKMDDYTTANVIYVGKAVPGSSAASAVWQIQKIDTTSGIVITWADGDKLFDNVWNNRATTVTYS